MNSIFRVLCGSLPLLLLLPALDLRAQENEPAAKPAAAKVNHEEHGKEKPPNVGACRGSDDRRRIRVPEHQGRERRSDNEANDASGRPGDHE